MYCIVRIEDGIPSGWIIASSFNELANQACGRGMPLLADEIEVIARGVASAGTPPEPRMKRPLSGPGNEGVWLLIDGE